MRLRCWSKTSFITLAVPGVMFVMFWRVCYPPTAALTPFNCTPLPSASYALREYLLQMDGSTPVISDISRSSCAGSFTGALLIFCSQRGEPETIVPSPLTKDEHLLRRFGQVAWSAHRRCCAFMLFTNNGNRLYVWQNGQWRWHVPLPDGWKDDAHLAYVINPFDNGRVLCYQTEKQTAGEYCLAEQGRILAGGTLPSCAKLSGSGEPCLHFSKDGNYCYANDNKMIRLYSLQVQSGRLIFHAVSAISADAEIRELFNDDPPLHARAIDDSALSHQVHLIVYDMQGKGKTLTSPRCSGQWEAFIAGKACGGTLTSEMIGMAQVRSGKTWSCRRLNSTSLTAHYTTANGQSLLVTIQRPQIYNPLGDGFAALPLLGKQCAAYRRRQCCRQQGLYEAVTCPGRHHALFHLSGVYQNKEYQICQVCLLQDDHTILALANSNNGKVLLGYHW